jgi:LysR family glycine cleavage system transcriptional activator
MDGLTRGHLKLLVSAADGESFTFAAAQRGISSAAVSEVVRRLEQRLGVPLFVRDAGGCALPI